MFPVVFIWISAVFGKDVPYYETNALITEDGRRIYGGDMIFNSIFNHEDDVEGNVEERSKFAPLPSRWPNGNIPMKISPELESSKPEIYAAMKIWNDETCVHFYEDVSLSDTVHHHLVLKETGTGCNSGVGFYSSVKEQITSLDKDCLTIPIIVHELGHVLGLQHQHDRADRLSYLTVYKENMDPARREDLLTEDMNLYGIPYDYSSIMQYSAYAFSINDRATFVPHDPLAEALMGNAQRPSYLDYKLVNMMYGCTKKCKRMRCYNNGYASWNGEKCRCKCPPGFTGVTCKKPSCLQTITSPGIIKTPNYPDNMPTNIHCAWLIKAPVNKSIRVKFHTFHLLRPDNRKCPWDSLRIKTGNLQSDDPGKICCGDELKFETIIGQIEILLVLLTSNISDGNTGFQADNTFV